MAEDILLAIQPLGSTAGSVSGPIVTSLTITHDLRITLRIVCSSYQTILLLRLSWDEPMLKYLRHKGHLVQDYYVYFFTRLISIKCIVYQASGLEGNT